MTDDMATIAAQDAVLGWPVLGWGRAIPADPRAIDGRYCRIEPLVPAHHAPQPDEAYHADDGAVNWDYLPYGPSEALDDFEDLLEGNCPVSDPLFYKIFDIASGLTVGMANHFRNEPQSGVIETGHKLCAGVSTNPGGHRGDVPDDAAGVRLLGLSPV